MFRHPVSAIALVMLFASAGFSAQTAFKGYTFDAKVVKSNGRHYREFPENDRIMLKVRPNEEYSIVVRNPLPVRAAVAVSIDGLNSIDGKRTTPGAAKKWIIGPNSTITIAGWQTSKQTLRKFVFTEQTAAYAQWKEEKEGKKYTQNLGVIGVAWFWNGNELETALHPPQPFAEDGHPRARGAAPSAAKAASMPSRAPSESKAGTGMGRQQQNQVREVAFVADAGMYSVKSVLKIYYEFAQEPEEPLPFVDDEEGEDRFAADMYK